MTYFASCYTLSASLGFFVGGMIGKYSIPLVFVCQISALLLVSIANLICVGENQFVKKGASSATSLCKINVLRNLDALRNVLNIKMLILLIPVFFQTQRLMLMTAHSSII